MLIKTPQRLVNTEGSLSIDGNPIASVSSTSYLGVIIDQDMTWKAHIDKIRKLIAPLVGIISKIRHIVPKSILLLLYNSMILPHICYCIEIWGNTFSSLLKPLLILQKKVVRFITFSDARAHTASLFQQLGILNIYKQCEFNTCTFIFDLKNGSFSHSVYRYLDPVPHNYSTHLKLLKTSLFLRLSLRNTI